MNKNNTKMNVERLSFESIAKYYKEDPQNYMNFYAWVNENKHLWFKPECTFNNLRRLYEENKK